MPADGCAVHRVPVDAVPAFHPDHADAVHDADPDAHNVNDPDITVRPNNPAVDTFRYDRAVCPAPLVPSRNSVPADRSAPSPDSTYVSNTTLDDPAS